MKKILVLLLSIFLLVGCQTTSQYNLNQQVELSFFYITTCSECKAFKKTAIPYLEKAFQDQIVIKQYDLDDSKTEQIYDQVIDSLVDFDESMYGYGPFIVVDGYFAILGYTAGDEKYLVDDIIKALDHEPLSDELAGMRFMFKES